MYSRVLKFSAPLVSCKACIKPIRKKIVSCFAKQYHDFELVNFFDSDLVAKTISLTVRVHNEKLTDQEIADTLLKDFSLDDIGQELVLLRNTPYKNVYLDSIISLLSAGFWFAVSFGVVVLPPLWYAIVTVLSTATLLYVAHTFFKRAAWQLIHGISGQEASWLNMDSLFALTGLIIVIATLLSLFIPGFPNLLLTGFLIFGFRHLGVLLQTYLDKKIDFSKSLVEMLHKRIYKLNDGSEIHPQDLSAGQIIKINKHDIFPIDGILRRASSNLQIRDLVDSGSYQKIDCKLNTMIFAGSECLEGECEVEVTNSIFDSRLGLIDKAMNNLADAKTDHQVLTILDTVMHWFIPGILLTATISFIAVSQFFALSVAIHCAIAVMVSACPCTLGLIIPMALRMAAYRASVGQVFFQTSDALHKLADIDLLVMDFNGTLTKGEVTIQDFVHLDTTYDKQSLFNIIYTIENTMLEKRPGHFLGKKIIDKIGSSSLVAGETEDLVFAGTLHEWSFGNNELFKHLGLPVENSKNNRLYLFNQKNLVGYFDYHDELRIDTHLFLEKMHAMNKELRICTGADLATAQYIANECNINLDMISYNNRMVNKKQFLQQLKEEFPTKKIAMLGDAVNDKEAFSTCDLSIFLCNNNNQGFFSDSLQNSADVVVQSGKLMSIFTAMQLARETKNVIIQNLWISLTYNLIMLLVAGGVFLSLGVALPPALGVLLMIIQSLLLSLNTYRIMSNTNHEPENLNALTAT